MARVALSEYAAKMALHTFLGLTYHGLSFNADTDVVEKINEFVRPDRKYVVKVDEGVKRRMKQGLVTLDTDLNGVILAIENYRKRGYSYFLVEEYVPHDSSLEKYLSLERTTLGTVVSYSHKGGIDIEKHKEEVETLLLKDLQAARIVAEGLGMDEEVFLKLKEAFDDLYFSFLEINPLVVKFDSFQILDIAGEVDSAAEFFVQDWSSSDFRNARASKLTDEEKNILRLSAKSPAAFKLNVLNPDGSIFMLLSGGGASIVLADEVKNIGHGGELANYGEYSGNPNEEETYIYTKNLLSLLLKSESDKKVLIIAGGVANFTDVRITFKGIINAISEVSEKLKDQGIEIYVRRGGPHQKEGLKLISDFVSENGLIGKVHGPEMILTDIIHEAIK